MVCSTWSIYSSPIRLYFISATGKSSCSISTSLLNISIYSSSHSPPYTSTNSSCSSLWSVVLSTALMLLVNSRIRGSSSGVYFLLIPLPLLPSASRETHAAPLHTWLSSATDVLHCCRRVELLPRSYLLSLNIACLISSTCSGAA